MTLKPIQAGAHQGEDFHEAKYLTVDECVVYLRLRTRQALYRLIREQRLPVCRRGRLYLFDRADVDAWLRGTTVIEQRRLLKRA